MPERRLWNRNPDPDAAGRFGEPVDEKMAAVHYGGKLTYRDIMESLPAMVEESRARGLPITFPEEALPANPGKRSAAIALLETLGVELTPSDAAS